MTNAIKRVDFDVQNPEHRLIAVQYLRTNRWEGNVRFNLSNWRWNNIPAMLSHELIEYYATIDHDLLRVVFTESDEPVNN